MDERLAPLIGKTIYIEVHYFDYLGNAMDHEQIFGRIKGPWRSSIEVELLNQPQPLDNRDATTLIPADFESIRQAAPGDYRVDLSGKIVHNPELIFVQNIKRPSPDELRGETTFARIVAMGVFKEFERFAKSRSRKRMIKILQKAYFSEEEATLLTAAILKEPWRYGY